MSAYWPDFAKLALAHLLALVSPGPDFAMVLRQSLRHGRRAAVVTAIGIGSGICVHVSYSLLGLGLLVRSSVVAFDILKFAGAAYLAWIGIQSLRTSAGGPAAVETAGETPAARPDAATGMPAPKSHLRDRSAWGMGFMTNALNPKATLFFVAIFATLVNPRTPGPIKLGYGAWIVLTTTAWFVFVACVFAHEKTRRSFLRQRRWIDGALGVIFLAFAAALVVASAH